MEQSDAKTAVKKLKQQNDKLKSELGTIKKSLNQAISTQKTAEVQSKRPNFSEDNEDETIKALHKKLQKLKKERDSLKSQSSNAHEDTNTVLENEIKYLKTQLKEANNEQKLLEKILVKQGKGFEEMNQGQLSAEKKRELEEEIRKTRDEYKKIALKIKTEEPEWKQDHERMVQLKEKLREKKPKAEEDNKKGKEPDDEIKELTNKLKTVKKSLLSEEAKGKRVITEAQNGLSAAKAEEEALRKKIADKDEELQLKVLKIKELKSSVTKLQKNISGRPKEEEEKKAEDSDGENKEKVDERHRPRMANKVSSKPNL